MDERGRSRDRRICCSTILAGRRSGMVGARPRLIDFPRERNLHALRVVDASARSFAAVLNCGVVTFFPQNLRTNFSRLVISGPRLRSGSSQPPLEIESFLKEPRSSRNDAARA